MRAVGLAALAVATLGVVVFVFVELHAASSPAASAPSSPSSPPSSAVEPPVVARPAPTPSPTPTATSGADLSDPMDHVVQGKTRREWRVYFAEQQRRITAEIDRNQEIIEDSSDGKEHDWPAVKDAHQRVRELRERMKQDLEELSRIENAP
jgi:hypothetical protein